MQPTNQPPFTLDHLDHVVLRVQDLERSTAFYRMLGGEVGKPREAGTPVRITDGQTILLQSHPEYVPAELTAIDHINLHVRAESRDQVVNYLKSQGVEGLNERGESGNTVRILDPDRNTIEIRVMPAAQ
jgi:glyoxylase I family protein